MVKAIVLGFLSLTIMSGCDPFYGPKIMNSFGFDVEVTVAYSNRQSTTTIWPPCRTAFIGKQDLEIEKISVAQNGKVIRQFTAEEVRDLLRKEKDVPGYSVWSVSADDLTLITSQSNDRCVEGQATSNANHD